MGEKFNILVGDANPVTMDIMANAAGSLPDVDLASCVRSMGMLKVKLKYQRHDLLVLDFDSEEMGGVTVIDVIRRIDPDIPIVVVSDPETADPDLAVKALEKGVHCCIAKPARDRAKSFNEFRLQLLTITGLLKSRKFFSGKANAVNRKTQISQDRKTPDQALMKEEQKKRRARITRVSIIVMASSTGGPGALLKLVPRLPGNIGVPVLLVQHMPSHITGSFARSLDEKSAVGVVEAAHGDEIFPSKVYIAPGGRHMTVTQPDNAGRRFIALNDDPPENSVRPSADVLFRSVAASFNGGILAVVLTGMGDDGKKGIQVMKEKGCLCFSQTADTCVVYGMPRAVDLAGLSDDRIPLEGIASRVVSAVKKGELT